MQATCSFIFVWDANNLYGFAMSQNLPTHDFSWTHEDVDFMNIPENSNVGYIFEVDLEYPHELHHAHNCYPLAPEKIAVSPSDYSLYTKEIAQKLNFNVSNPSEKLIPNLRNKIKYVVHYRNLKFYVELGLKVTKVYRILKFKQSPWLKNYIDFNTEHRKKATNNFEKDLFKLLNNAVFGKTMENLRNRVTIDLVTDERKSRKLVASPAFHAFTIINDDLVSVQRKKTSLLLNRPIYVGFSILDISKIIMYDFHYNFIKKLYGERAKLLFTDTDSLCYCIHTLDIYKDIYENISLFDTSNYPPNHFLYNPINNKVLGKMKDELSGNIACEFVGLKAKMYSLKTLQFEKQVAKGVAKSILKNKIQHEDYKNCIFNVQRTRHAFKTISSSRHVLNTIQCNKISLCPFDDKRYVLEDVPEERLQNFAVEHLSELDRQMKSILQNNKISDSEKIILYQQILQKFVNFRLSQEESRHNDKIDQEFSEKETEAENEGKDIPNEDSKFILANQMKEETGTIEEEIERSAPKKFKHLTPKLINFFRENEKEIFWSPQKELVINGKIIRNTNVVDLIIHLIRDRKEKPYGHELFYDTLKRKKFPLTFVKNKYLKRNVLYAKPIQWIEY
ncbi:hypothetical protein HNY73_003339 [Argiope bruennichi]|uniref:DNA-directed DNA polymerase n=1 Tax=Argiope bruennichi TaxID=94029 RepID=A0A8T0FZ04_ARGBR|nr:hypothetical protein HNY73_003339 [Argiope bruennichi]